MTGIYNVLYKLRTGEDLSEKEHVTHDQSVCGTLLNLHQALDREFAAAYGWPGQMEHEEILEAMPSLGRARTFDDDRFAER